MFNPSMLSNHYSKADAPAAPPSQFNEMQDPNLVNSRFNSLIENNINNNTNGN